MPTPTTKEPSSDNIIDTVTVGPYGLATLHIGIYETVIPEPELQVTIDPAIDNLLSSSLERLETDEDEGEYELIYHFQNYSSQPCKVTVGVRMEDARF